MRPFLLFRPGGDVPEAIRGPLEKAGTEVLVAGTLEEAGTLLYTSMPDVLLVVPPGTAADAATLLSLLPHAVAPPSVFVLADDGAPRRPLALETIARSPWNRATAALGEDSDDPAPAILLSRVQLTSLLELWEQFAAEGSDFIEHALRALSLSLDASRVSLFRWQAGSAVATLQGSAPVASAGRWRARAIRSCAPPRRDRAPSAWKRSTATPAWVKPRATSKARRSGPCSAGSFPAREATSTFTRSASACRSASWTWRCSGAPRACSGPRTTRAGPTTPWRRTPTASACARCGAFSRESPTRPRWWGRPARFSS